MGTFVLIHGAWHGSWCWNKVVPLLKKSGHEAVTPDLPGHGDNTGKYIEEITIQDYADCVVEVLDGLAESVILVGHSLGGKVISQVAEYRPGKVKKLVYLCAFMPDPRDMELQLPAQKRLEPLTMSDTALQELFYGDCSGADFEWARALLVPEPGAPRYDPIHVTGENYGRIPRIYIETLRDQAIVPSRQKQMYTDMPCERVISMDTSHSPFISAPEELVRNLISVL